MYAPDIYRHDDALKKTQDYHQMAQIIVSLL